MDELRDPRNVGLAVHVPPEAHAGSLGEPYAPFLMANTVPGEPEASPPHSPQIKDDSSLSKTNVNIEGHNFRYLGQFAATYLIISTGNDERIVLLDQHAAHERIIYENLRRGGTRGTGQALLVPLSLTLHPAEEEQLLEIRDILVSMGFGLTSDCGVCTVNSLPAGMERSRATGFLREALSGKLDGQDKIWISHACHTAIRAGEPLDRADALELIRQWLLTEEPDYCPHGRPCCLAFSLPELEKLFKRRQS